MNKNGIALIMAVGVLALLAIIATSFALNMRLEYHAAMNYYSGVKARYFAEAALARAIAELRTHVKSSAFDDQTENWAKIDHATDNASEYNNKQLIDADKAAVPPRITTNGTSVATIVKDNQRKIDANVVDPDDTAKKLLNNLAEILKKKMSEPLQGDEGTIIIQNRPNSGYANLREIMTGANADQITKAKFDVLDDYVTINSYKDGNCVNRAPVNINTADKVVVAAVLRGLASDKSGPVPVDKKVNTISVNTAWDVAERIIQYRMGTGTFDSWKKFNDAIDKAIDDKDLTNDEGLVVKYNCNPNMPKPSTHTTEFCFNSGGYYTVTATGSVTGSLGAPIASNTLSAVVKIYDIYCETTKAQFERGNEDKDYDGILDAGEDTNGNGVLDVPIKVTWLDSCPVKSTDLFGVYTLPSPLTIDDSIKLGFWDDFRDTTYSNTKWNYTGSTEIKSGRLCLTGTPGASAKASLASTLLSTVWENYYSVSLFEDDSSSPTARMSDVGWIYVKGINAGNPVVLHAGDNVHTWDDVMWAYQKPSPATTGKVEFLTPAAASPRNKYGYLSQIRIFRIIGAASPENDDTNIYRTLLAYDTKKRYNITVDKSTSKIATTVYTTSPLVFGSYTTLSDTSFNIGFAVYTGVNTGNKWWDDIRLIPRNGNFTSQVINSTLSPSIVGNVGWGTITGTVTIPSTASAGSEKVTFQTKSNADGVTWKNANPAAGGAIGSIVGNNIQYKALLTTASPQIKETPVLEDITITYLPKVAIKSYSLSQ